MEYSSKGISQFAEEIESRLYERLKDLIAEEKEEVIEERFKKVNRIRGGKVQRRKKVSTRSGYTFRNGKLTRMTSNERRRRSVSQTRASKKRRGTQARANRKRKISMVKRKRIQ